MAGGIGMKQMQTEIKGGQMERLQRKERFDHRRVVRYRTGDRRAVRARRRECRNQLS